METDFNIDSGYMGIYAGIGKIGINDRSKFGNNYDKKGKYDMKYGENNR